MINSFFVSRTGDRPWLSRFAAVLLAAMVPVATLPAQQAPAAGPQPAAQTTPAPGQSASAQSIPVQSSLAQPSQAKNVQPAGAAQPAAPGEAETDVGTPTLRLGANEVDLIFTVTDNRGHYIPNLKQSDFALLDDQRAPAEVTSFHQQINLPLRVGILIDTSTSIHSRFQFEQQAATEFLLQILKAKADRAFVMGFDVTPDLKTDWTNDIDALQTGISHMSPGGGTALFDAVYTACRDKLLTARGQEPVRKAIILLSDGDDNQSRVYLPEAIKECERAETIVYAISTNWTPSRGRGDKILQQLAEETGGEVFFPPSVEDLSNSFQDIATELRSQYALTYTPAEFKYDGSFRTIYLYCYDRRYKVRAKKGYFAPRQ
jgi:Ca-activated chloride channel homolog